MIPDGFWTRTHHRRQRQGVLYLHFVLRNNIERTMCGINMNSNLFEIKIDDRKDFHVECLTCQAKIQFFKTTGLTKALEYQSARLGTRKLKTKQKSKPLFESGGVFTQTKCPECQADVIFWNEKKQREHLCTVCDKLVELGREIVA
ncbi:MAG: hypothetical protein JKY15_01905 [Deltaproteobacteria bacterium]|nr:hypothetical protein [Deltaproteobacteria bacterium]